MFRIFQELGSGYRVLGIFQDVGSGYRVLRIFQDVGSGCMVLRIFQDLVGCDGSAAVSIMQYKNPDPN